MDSQRGSSHLSSVRKRLAWSAGAAFGPQLAQFIGFIVLARLLAPADFGLVVIAMTVLEFSTLLQNSGVSSYIVYARSPDQRQISTAFWLNLILSILVGFLVLLSTNLIAGLFNSPAAAPLIQLSALGCMLNVGATHLGLLQRRFRFDAVAVSDTASMVFSQIGAIALAVFGMGPLSIILGRLGGQTVQLGLYITFSKWLPSWTIDRKTVRDVWRYSRHVLGFNIVNYWTRNLDNLIIARSAGVEVLGFYSRAYTLMLLPVTLVSGSIGKVLLPTLARQQHDLALAMATWTEYTLLSFLIGLPAAAIFVAAPDVVTVALLGGQWGGAAQFLQILALSILPQMVIRPLGFAFQALGRTRAQLLIGLINTAVTACMMLVGNALLGANGVALGFTCGYFVHLGIYLSYAQLRWQLRSSLLIWPAVRLLIAGAVAALSAELVKKSTGDVQIHGRLAVLILVSTATYLVAVWLLAPDVLRKALELLKRK